MTLLSPQAACAYWDERHRREGDLRSGGHVSLDEPSNQIFYTVRLGLLLNVVGHYSSTVAPLFLLDAGCGKGWFSRELARFGHTVDGIDASPNAIAYCESAGGGPRYFRSSLSGWRSPWLYDVVTAVDVVFHITGESEWELSVRNLASLTRLRAKLVISDWGEDGDHIFGDYQIVRGRNRYLPLMEECGMRFDGWLPYGFRGSPIGFYVFTRVC